MYKESIKDFFKKTTKQTVIDSTNLRRFINYYCEPIPNFILRESVDDLADRPTIHIEAITTFCKEGIEYELIFDKENIGIFDGYTEDKVMEIILNLSKKSQLYTDNLK